MGKITTLTKKLAKATTKAISDAYRYATTKHCKKCGIAMPPNTKYDWCYKCYQEYATKTGQTKRRTHK